MSSGWFNPSKLVRTIVQHTELPFVIYWLNTGSEWGLWESNQLELMRIFPTSHCDILRNYHMRRFGKVEPPRTHVKLHHRSGPLWCAMVRTGYHIIPGIARCVEFFNIRESRTNSNWWATSPLALLPLWYITGSLLVQCGFGESNQIELMRFFPTSPCSLCDILVQYWYNKIRESRTNLNWWESSPLALFPLWV